MDRTPPSEPVLPYPSSRYYQATRTSYYYAYGVDPAIDYLQSVFNEKAPSVLVLECGDILFYFYTLWKNFSSYSVSTTGSHFTGTRFVLSNHSAAVLARSVLLVYLALKTPSKSKDARKWLSSMWSIWFCHELLPAHKQVLQKALTTLLSLSENAASWTEERNILRNIINFSKPATLSKIRSKWSMWLNDDFGSVQQTSEKRMALMSKETFPQCFFTERAAFSKQLVQNYTVSHVDDDGPIHQSMREEVVSYIERGSVYAEEVLGLDVNSHTAVNPTFYETDNHSYVLYYGSVPFTCFFHAVKFSIESAAPGLNPNQVTVKKQFFDMVCLLANSVQQFAVWVQAVQEILQPVLDHPEPDFTLTLDCSDDSLQYCQQKRMENSLLGSEQAIVHFDVIYQMYRFDVVSMPALVLCAANLLKESGVLFTTTYCYRCAALTVEDYLEDQFGFPWELLPVVCGIHCIGHEGQHANASTPQALNPATGIRQSTVLAWQRIVEHAHVLQKIQDISQPEDVENALMHSLMSSFLPFFAKVGLGIRSLLCTETALQVFLSFVSQLEQSVLIDSYQFWDHFCKRVQTKFPSLSPLLTHIQTQALMHKLHLHLTVTKSDCPLCTHQPLSDSIALYSVVVDDLQSKTCRESFTYIISIQRDLDKDTVQSVITEGFTTLENCESVHIVDSFFYTLNSGQIRVDFYFPKKFAELGYYCSLWFLSEVDDHPQIVVQEVFTSKLTALEAHDRSYYFHEVATSLCQPFSNLGLTIEHYGHQEVFYTVVLLSPDALKELQTTDHECKTGTTAESVVKVEWGDYFIKLFYPYPVEDIKVTFQGRVMYLLAYRKEYQFQSTRRLYTTNPDNLLCFPAVLLKQKICQLVGFLQFFTEEKILLLKQDHEPEQLTPTVCLKESLREFFQTPCDRQHFIFLVGKQFQVVCLAVRERIVFDVQAGSPAMDIYFHFMHRRSSQLVVPGWNEALRREGVRTTYIRLLLEDFALLRQYFFYYATILKQKQNSAENLTSLLGEETGQHFSRAVIYPLYVDVDCFFQDYRNNAEHIDVGKWGMNELENVNDIVAPLHNLDFLDPTKEFFKSLTISKHISNPANQLCESAKPVELVSTSPEPTELSCNSPETTEQFCEQCHLCGPLNVKCPHCKQTLYCSRECQIEDRNKHCQFYQPANPEPAKQAPDQHATIQMGPTAASKASLAVSPVEQTPVLDKCARCRRRDRELRPCRQCQLVAYCSKKCREKHLSRHLPVCKPSQTN